MTFMQGPMNYPYYAGGANFMPHQAFPLHNPGSPYAEYPMPMSYPGMMYGAQYAQGANLAAMYGTPIPDTFERGYVVQDEGRKSFRESILDSAKNVKDKISNSPTIWKGVVGAGVILTTLICLLNGGKKTPVASGPSFWSKLNPKNWFKK